MSVYSPSIPQSTDLISTSQGQILTNFDQLNEQFGVDHTPFNNSGVNGDGHHTQVTLEGPTSQTPIGAISVYHSINGANFFDAVPIAMFANSMGDYPLLPDLLSTVITGTSSTGTLYSFKLGNIIFNYGQIVFSATSSITISLPVGFQYTSSTSYSPTAVYIPGALTTPPINIINNSSFTIASISASTVSFFAIGS